jgi:hypothetical protein
MGDKAPTQSSAAWLCSTCHQKEQMTHAQMLDHIKTIHKLEPKGLPCKKSLSMHMRGSGYSLYQWDITITHPTGEIKMMKAETIVKKRG